MRVALHAQDGFGGGPSIADQINIDPDGFGQLLEKFRRVVRCLLGHDPVARGTDSLHDRNRICFYVESNGRRIHLITCQAGGAGGAFRSG